MKMTAALVAFAAVVTFLVPPDVSGAVEVATAPPDHVDVTLAGPAGGDDDDDGLLVSSTPIDLSVGVDGDEPADGHEDRDHAFELDREIITVDLPAQPDSVFFDEVVDGTALAVRWSEAGTWSRWTELVATRDEGPDAGGPDVEADARPGVGPIWLGGTVRQLQIRILDGPAQRIGLVAVHDVVDESGPVGIRSTGGTAVNASSIGSTPYGIRPRSAWATAAMIWQCPAEPPKAAQRAHGVIVHHTADRKAYSEAEVPAIIRSMWYFHTGPQRGWCDIGYNFVVDRFGGKWEARAGSLDVARVGSHAVGYNTGSVGVALLGHFDHAGPSSTALYSASHIAGWAAQKWGFDPAMSRVWPKFEDPSGNKYLPVISGHRNFGTTACPGANLYAQLPMIRTSARNFGVVPRMHREFLQRDPAGTDLARWAMTANSSGLTAAALGMAHTEEYAGLIIDQFYRDVLGRAPDATGRRYWVNQLNNGLRVEDVGVYFYGGEEYYKKTGGGRDFVTALYRKLLHREPEPSGLEYWNSKLEEGHPPYVIAASFYRGIESRRDRVTRLYQRFLHRAPDVSGREYWAGVLLDHDDLELAAYLASSEEYQRRALS